MDKLIKNKKDLELVTNLSSGFKTYSKKIFFSLVYHLDNFHDLTLNGFWNIPKITFVNSCKLIHNGIFIPVSPGPLNLENVERKGKIEKFEYLENEKSFL